MKIIPKGALNKHPLDMNSRIPWPTRIQPYARMSIPIVSALTGLCTDTHTNMYEHTYLYVAFLNSAIVNQPGIP
eukprot:12400679-Karenia_brevis.AAC.1